MHRESRAEQQLTSSCTLCWWLWPFTPFWLMLMLADLATAGLTSPDRAASSLAPSAWNRLLLACKYSTQQRWLSDRLVDSQADEQAHAPR